MTEKDLSRALRDSVADVTLSPAVREAVRDHVNGGYPMRYKWKVGLVLVLALLLATAAAGAWTVSRGFIEKTAALQYESGFYDDWSLAEKRGFVDVMAEYGLMEPETAKALKNQEEDSLDAWMAMRYGIQGRTDTIGLVSIAEAELGPMTEWPNETWVWYNQLERSMGRSSVDGKICVTPGEEAVPAELAIAAAREAIEAMGGPSQQQTVVMKTYWTYETQAEDEAHENARYYIRFAGEGGDLWAEVTREGTVVTLEGIQQIAQAEEVSTVAEAGPVATYIPVSSVSESATGVWDVADPNFELYLHIQSTYADEHGLKRSDENQWPLEAKKAVADMQEPLVKGAILANHWNLTPGMLYQTIYGYGVPDAGVIQQEEAVEIVRKALTETFGYSQQIVDFYFSKEMWVDYLTRNASDEGHPVWKVTFWCRSYDELKAVGLKDEDHDLCVYVDAMTGQVLTDRPRCYSAQDDPKVAAMRQLLKEKGAPANWTDEEWSAYLPWPRETQASSLLGTVSESATGVWDVEDPHFHTYVEIEVQYAEAHGLDLAVQNAWPLADKQAVAELQEPLIKEAILGNHWNLTPGELYQTIYGYGVPDASVIQEAEAVEIAHRALTEKFGLSADVAEYYASQMVWVHYLVRNASEEGHPVYKVTFACKSQEEMAAHGVRWDANTVTQLIDAVTGEVLSDALTEYNASADPKVQAMQQLLQEKGEPANWTEEEWNLYLPWPREK